MFSFTDNVFYAALFLALCCALPGLHMVSLYHWYPINNDYDMLILQAMCVAIDKLIRLQVINCSTVVNWIFCKELLSEFTRYVHPVIPFAIPNLGRVCCQPSIPFFAIIDIYKESTQRFIE